ncbi:MAG: dicarboxylate/amino acid:cation symporter [Saprospiraceae bacterium]|nr:dicarboxylate/amino acid:cation symporter [Saprospiraceae bacterium]MDW8484984.1 dicarboxylate/amino acid:cation symporter [Saprospiraceae bacterium]
MPWYRQMHWQIIVGLLMGLLFGILCAAKGWSSFTKNWVAPFGDIFLNGLKLVAVPLVLGSLISGVTSLSDVSKLGRIGGKTLVLYITTTAVAITIGLVLANIVQPGAFLPAQMRNELMAAYSSDVESSRQKVQDISKGGPLKILTDMVPSNIFSAAANNSNMLQVVFFAIFFGIGLLQLPKDRAQPLIRFFQSLSEVSIRLVDIIMLMAPLGVFALIANTITVASKGNLGQLVGLLQGLLAYCLTVVGGLALHTFGVYHLILRLFSKMSFRRFVSGIGKAQLVAFSTSSSGATLPVTMECCEEKLGVSEEVSSFVLPLGATINMDGTALYQGVATVFIAQALGMNLSISTQVNVLLLAVMASIGTAAVPGAGVVMLIIILESIGVPSAGIALILGVDRILDMLRTVTNVTGDCVVAVSVAASEGQLRTTLPGISQDEIRLKN